MQNMQMAAGELGSRLPGVVNGLTFEVPSSGLAALYDGGNVNVVPANPGAMVDE